MWVLARPNSFVVSIEVPLYSSGVICCFAVNIDVESLMSSASRIFQTIKYAPISMVVASLLFLGVGLGLFFINNQARDSIETLPIDGAVFGDWVFKCEHTADSSDICFLSQEQHDPNTNALVLKLSVGKLGPQKEKLVVAMLPLGVDLRVGAALRIDQNDQLPMITQQCRPEGCVATLAVTDQLVKTLNAAKEIIVGAVPFGHDQAILFTVSVKGLNDGLEAIRL